MNVAIVSVKDIHLVVARRN